MSKTINMLELRGKIGEVLDHVYYKKDIYIIRRGRKKMAALVPLEDFEIIKGFKEEKTKRNKIS